jgi:membrane-bound lytic murein transglycosylase A
VSPDRTREPPRFAPAQFNDLPGFADDPLDGFMDSAKKTCTRLATLDPARSLRMAGAVANWQPFCRAITAPNADPYAVVTTHLVPWRVTIRGSGDGLFTGYYEASLRGSRTRHGPYQTPIRGIPRDHAVIDLSAFKPEWAGMRATAQIAGGPGAWTLRPYPDRKGIETGAIPPGHDRIIAWVDDPVDAFFLEIQGSGRIALDDGSVMHVGYAERNGQAYTAVGKVLVERGILTKETASMQTIRAWMAENPGPAVDIRRENPSAIFFRELDGDGPVGGENVTLTPLRSLAIDKNIWPYGLPFYIDAAAPTGNPAEPRVRRLMMGQDTGGAIKGAIRGDVFWGYGDEAAYNAGLMKSRGHLWVLLPHGVDPRAYATANK